MHLLRAAAVLAAVGFVGSGCAGDDDSDTAPAAPRSALGEQLRPAIDHPYVAFALVERAVYEGEEVDPESGERVALRVESVVQPEPAGVAGARVTVVRVDDYENGELVERTRDFYAQHSSGDVYYLGERVDEYEDGKVVSHAGQWVAGEKGYRPGVFMPAAPAVGAKFEQERAPGVAEDHSVVIEDGLMITVPAGTFNNCIKTRDVDPIDGVTEHKYYCHGVGLVKEEYESGALVLVEYSPGPGNT